MNNKELITKNTAAQQLAEQKKLDALAKSYIQQSLATSTQKFYKIDFHIFCTWCDSFGAIALPATPDTVIRFLASQASLGKKPATLIRRLAAIKAIHEAKGYDTPTQHKGVKAALKGIKREKGMAQKKKTPATAERIADMIAYCPETLTGLRDKALLLLGFGGAFRRSELTALKVNDIEYTPEGIKVIIRKSKADQEGQGQVVAVYNGTRFRVVEVLMAWLKAANINDGYIFRAVNQWNQIQPSPLTGKSIAKIVKKYAGLAGFTVADFSGHSLRAGFITSSAAADASMFKIMEVSRHKKPETVMGYVRESKLFENHAGKTFS